MSLTPLTPEVTGDIEPTVTARVLYADVDRMAVVYHGSYFRYLELARIELLRQAGLSYVELEAAGLAVPVVDLAVRYHRPAEYDDLMTIRARLVKASRVRLHFQYRVTVEPGDRRKLDERIQILTAETRHCCVRRDTGRPERLPADAWAILERMVARPGT